MTLARISILLALALRSSALLPARPARRALRAPPRLAVAEAAAVPAAVSLAAGMAAGAIGVGVAYPLDTLKTKMQAYDGRARGGGDGDDDDAHHRGAAPALGPLGVASAVLREEGLAGFYGGVVPTMAGQAIIKGVLFFVYDAAKAGLLALSAGGAATAAAAAAARELSSPELLVAAAVSGAAASVFSTPIERIKVVMQAAPAGAFPRGWSGSGT